MAVTFVFFTTRETPVLRLIAIYGYVITAGSALAGILLTSGAGVPSPPDPWAMPSSFPLYAWTLWRGWPLIGAIGREILADNGGQPARERAHLREGDPRLGGLRSGPRRWC